MQSNLIPNYHFMLFAPNLGGEYFFEAARAYWDTFRPIVMADLRFLQLVPGGNSVSVTVVALRDTIAQIGVELGQQAPYAYLDPVVYDSFAETRAELNRRAQTNQPFGVPLGLGIATTTPLIPTPWLPASGPGFVTATPSATPASPVATAAASPPPPPGAVENTPGPAIGGS